MEKLSKILAITSSPMKITVFLLALIAGTIGFAQPAVAATAYYVSANDVYVRPRPQSYAMGRLYNHTNTGYGRMDVQYVDSNGWAYGYAYGFVNRCVWAQYSYRDSAGVYHTNFRTHGTTVSNKCRTTNMYLDKSEFTNGEIWSNSSRTDGVLCRKPRTLQSPAA